ncbi:MAG TPA: cupredoxin domain-containing protein [Mycobacteriales bacterium]|nr:cupredoxin domain-containing protein [Mycobacteriales bacterium]
MRSLLYGATTALALAGTASLAGCGSSTPATPTNATGFSITIKDFGYGAPLTVSPGATVTVRNQDGPKHDVSGQGFTTSLLSTGESGTFTAPTAEGSYSYTCSIHARMHGELVVKAGATPAAAGGDSPAPRG